MNKACKRIYLSNIHGLKLRLWRYNLSVSFLKKILEINQITKHGKHFKQLTERIDYDFIV